MLHLTPEMLEASYELLRTTPPFRRWKLPEADDVIFRVIRSEEVRGTFELVKGRMVISISAKCVGNLHSLNATMAHEMVHLYEDTVHNARNDVMHSATFKRLAKQVCRHHGFDELLF
jgi:hypothetical protein